MEPKFIISAEDLVTTAELTKSGFFEQAIRKTKEAIPFVAQAKYLLKKLEEKSDPHEIVNVEEILNDLVTAAGFSDKATKYFTKPELKGALEQVIREMMREAISDWREEIVHRFLLTRGDTLGGIMRNITGEIARTKFIDAVQTALKNRDVKWYTTNSTSNKDRLTSIVWTNRLLLFDRKPSIIGKNVDVILLCQSTRTTEIKKMLSEEENYLVCGEIKGGIDPAGADEHWKTASGAFERIRTKLQGRLPKLFFVGAAIEKSMADEIFSQLQSGLLTHAANLNVPNQLSDLANWLISN